MIVIVGKRLYGAVDRVPGAFYVATMFWHHCFFPVLPLESYLVIEGSEKWNDFQGKPLPIHAKSVLMGWLRGLLVAVAIITFIGFCSVMGSGQVADALSLLGFTVASAVGFGFTYVLARPTVARARELAWHAGISPETVEALLLGTAAPQLAPDPGAMRPMRVHLGHGQGSSPEGSSGWYVAFGVVVVILVTAIVVAVVWAVFVPPAPRPVVIPSAASRPAPVALPAPPPAPVPSPIPEAASTPPTPAEPPAPEPAPTVPSTPLVVPPPPPVVDVAWQTFTDLGFAVLFPRGTADVTTTRLHVTTKKRQTLRLECKEIAMSLDDPKRTYWAATLALTPNMGTRDEVFSIVADAVADRWSASHADPSPVESNPDARVVSAAVASSKERLHARLLRVGSTLRVVAAVVSDPGDPPEETRRFLDSLTPPR